MDSHSDTDSALQDQEEKGEDGDHSSEPSTSSSEEESEPDSDVESVPVSVPRQENKKLKHPMVVPISVSYQVYLTLSMLSCLLNFRVI